MNPPAPAHRIHILDPATINQIAAGEVVERPASVVKELVENAIDAGAGLITIEITAGKDAITAIRVTDNGCGMSPEDARLAFVPHATSKIKTIGDLHTIRTLGFRGEALATIAAVAKVTLITKPKGSGAVAGTRIQIEGGKVTGTSGTGAPDGTSVLVEDLFYNTPVRKKFQKSRNTELAHIHDIIEGICLAHTDIAFRLSYNGTEQIITDRTSRPLDTIARLFGSSIIPDLVPLDAVLPLVTVKGYVSCPSLARKDRARLYVSVNHRFVTSPLINDAIKAGYGTLLARERFPVAFLHLTIDTTLVDVNVHPTKKKIRLSREKDIAEMIKKSVRDALLSHDLIPAAGAAPVVHPPGEEKPTAAVKTYTRESAGPPPAGVYESTHAGTLLTDQRLRQTELPVSSDLTCLVPSLLPEINVIGEFSGIYILARTAGDDLLLIDQHAAHERILYEQVTAQSRENRPSQELISPFVLNRTPKEAAVIRDLLPALASEGFIIEGFGGNSFLVRAVPVVLGRIEDTTIIDGIISDLTSEEASVSVSDRERITRIVACRGAVKAGTVCTREQCQRIVDQLRRAKNPFTCPHGRPTMIRFTRKELDTMFKRI
ncbi:MULTISPECIES: DNA mismatch repair endonuclease MutL [unclassified Methanoregula]|uniref:DNA mismatch repair endonuclease MutL n=1 Tax=unclassified Methanoregula TaxID=2649730 RepID=UPI0009CA1B8C|nr:MULTISPECIES: DNA mismatch repair endonuclease MutL [unclassified Methanoregula]OPX63398.1 MAG: DNA mismatch repair protein [Methanoregula sp. PtaB.Bin085]OPY35223.1 MAG: DNA mismatch repair protein [Methanoregula sp. PtaU1.Bin006]